MATPSFYLSWSMLSIGIKTKPAARDEKTELTNLHRKCRAKLNMEKKCSACQSLIGADDIVKGYAQDKEWVLIETAELDELDREKTKVMDVKGFIASGSLDPIYFGKSDYVTPADPSSAKPLALLRAAMENARCDALVQYVTHGREKIGLIRLSDRGLTLHELFYEYEVRESERGVDGAPGKAELELAIKLLKAGMIKTDLSQFEDGYRRDLNDLIQAKVKGQAVPAKKAAPKKEQVSNLLDALKKSLNSTTKKSKAA